MHSPQKGEKKIAFTSEVTDTMSWSRDVNSSQPLNAKHSIAALFSNSIAVSYFTPVSGFRHTGIKRFSLYPKPEFQKSSQLHDSDRHMSTLLSNILHPNQISDYMLLHSMTLKAASVMYEVV